MEQCFDPYKKSHVHSRVSHDVLVDSSENIPREIWDHLMIDIFTRLAVMSTFMRSPTHENVSCVSITSVAM